MQTYLAGGQIIVLSNSKRCIHEYFRHGGQVFNTQHLQPEKVPIYGLTMDCLLKEKLNMKSDVSKTLKNFNINLNQSSLCTCYSYESRWPSGATPASLGSDGNEYCSVRALKEQEVHPKLKILSLSAHFKTNKRKH